MGIQAGALVQEFTRDCERFGEIGQENCRCITGDGRLAKAGRVVAPAASWRGVTQRAA